MKQPPDFYIGWQAAPWGQRRRAVLGAAAALAGGGLAGLASLWARGAIDLGPGVWDTGQLRRLDGPLRTVFLASDGKAAAALPPALVGRRARVQGTLITRGPHAMLAVEGEVLAGQADPAGAAGAALAELHWPEPVAGAEVALTGDILDAKCWFGAMRPGFGKSHKACAALCARGGLPLAFCPSGECGSGDSAPLFVDAQGRPHGLDVLPYVADPVLVQGRLVRSGDVWQLRADLGAIRRIQR